MSSQPFNNRSDVLKEAETLVNGDRNDAYGDPIDDFRTTAELTTTTRCCFHDAPPQGVSVDMVS